MAGFIAKCNLVCHGSACHLYLCTGSLACDHGNGQGSDHSDGYKVYADQYDLILCDGDHLHFADCIAGDWRKTDTDFFQFYRIVWKGIDRHAFGTTDRLYGSDGLRAIDLVYHGDPSDRKSDALTGISKKI